MLDFLLTATDPRGERDTHRVKASDSQEAYRQLESQGFTEIVLHNSDDVAAAVPLTMLDNGRISPRDLLEIGKGSLFGAHWYMLKKNVRRWWWLGLLLVILCVIWPNPFLLMVKTGVGLGLVVAQVFVMLTSLVFPGSVGRRNALFDAYYWGRWDEVLKRVESLRGTVSDFDLDGCKAGALAGFGFVEEGLAVLKQWEDSDDISRCIYLVALSNFYRGADMFDESLRCMAEAYAEEPRSPVMMLNYSISLSREEQDPELAGKLIRSAEQTHLAESVSMSLLFAKGMWLSNCGETRAAIAEYEKLKERLRNFGTNVPGKSLLLDLAQAYLAVEYLNIGDRERAAQEAKPAMPRLHALNRTRLLEKLAEVAD